MDNAVAKIAVMNF